MTSTNRYSQAKLEYIERMGLLMESYGVSRMSGRVLGALLVAEPPAQTAEDLAATLQASRSSISVAIRMLEQLGYVDRVSRPGERKDYFRNRPNAWSKLFEQQLMAVKAFKALAEEGLGLLETDDPGASQGLIELRDLYAFFEREHPKILRAWEKERKKQQKQAKQNATKQ